MIHVSTEKEGTVAIGHAMDTIYVYHLLKNKVASVEVEPYSNERLEEIMENLERINYEALDCFVYIQDRSLRIAGWALKLIRTEFEEYANRQGGMEVVEGGWN
jgi:hypothetical protein